MLWATHKTQLLDGDQGRECVPPLPVVMARPVLAPSFAAERGREIARQNHSEHAIHRRNGTIGEKNSYAGDPQSAKGQESMIRRCPDGGY